MYNISINHCHYCKERWYNLSGNIDEFRYFECKICHSSRGSPRVSLHLLLAENDMNPKLYYLPDYLPILSDIKEMFITQVHIAMKVCRLSKGYIRCKGNILNME